MAKKTLIAHILGLGRPVFSARELSAVSGRSPSTVSQGLAFLAGEGLVVKVAHGLWAAGTSAPSPYAVVAHLRPKQRFYVSFTSALHLHGIIGQIPRCLRWPRSAHGGLIGTASGVRGAPPGSVFLQRLRAGARARRLPPGRAGKGPCRLPLCFRVPQAPVLISLN